MDLRTKAQETEPIRSRVFSNHVLVLVAAIGPLTIEVTSLGKLVAPFRVVVQISPAS
jgi:hypothetical protein